MKKEQFQIALIATLVFQVIDLVTLLHLEITLEDGIIFFGVET